MFIEAVIGSFVGAAFACPNVARTLETSTNTITTKLSDISDKVDGMNNTLLAMKSKISEIEIEQSRMFHAFQWHDLVQTLMAKNAVYIGNNILELKENDSVIQLNLVERSITETKFGKTYEKKFDGSEYIDGKCVHSKDTTCEKWFNLEGKCIHEVDSNKKETWYEYDTSNRCVHVKVKDGEDYKDTWYEFDTSNRCVHKKVEGRKDYKETWYEFDADGEVIRHHIKTYSNDILVEYGNVIHLVDTYSEAYFTKDVIHLVNTDGESYFMNDVIKGHTIAIVRDYDEYLIYYKGVNYHDLLNYFKDKGECIEKGGGITYYAKTDKWVDTKGEIKKEFFNFLTHTYEKRLSIAKHKLEEAKSSITTRIKSS